MPHLILGLTKSGHDGSITKTISRRLDMWNSYKFEQLFNEANVLRERFQRSSTKYSNGEFKMFDEQMTLSKISNALRFLIEKLRENS